MGNFVADGMRAQGSLKLGQPIDLAIMNGGGLRRNSISEGELRKRDIFELLPFENALVTLELTGEQVIKLLGVVISSREAQSGALIVYFTKADKTSEFESAKLRGADGREVDIDPKASYRVVTIDYLINVGGERYAILRQGKNIKPLGNTLRDAIMAYVQAETAAGRDIKSNLDDRFYLDRAKSAATEDVPPQ
jgi:2',3'-cyclic-nucleotide 2'-phosphodiesterase (5'-nucleotidase family)